MGQYFNSTELASRLILDRFLRKKVKFAQQTRQLSDKLSYKIYYTFSLPFLIFFLIKH